jgi:hypothetical protein
MTALRLSSCRMYANPAGLRSVFRTSPPRNNALRSAARPSACFDCIALRVAARAKCQRRRCGRVVALIVVARCSSSQPRLIIDKLRLSSISVAEGGMADSRSLNQFIACTQTRRSYRFAGLADLFVGVQVTPAQGLPFCAPDQTPHSLQHFEPPDERVRKRPDNPRCKNAVRGGFGRACCLGTAAC